MSSVSVSLLKFHRDCVTVSVISDFLMGSSTRLVLAVLAVAPCTGAATTTTQGSPRCVALHARYSPCPVAARTAALLRIRGGVRQLGDRDDWDAVQAEAGEKLLVVDFTATWCGPCQRIAPAFAQIADEYAERALFVKIDVDVLGELAAELGVTSMPTFLFFRSGHVIDTMRGADEAGLRALVAEHAA